MADIFNGGTVKLFYNLDTANQNVISSGNIEIENVATFPTFSISDSANKIETYDSEYTRTVVGDKAIGDLEIVVNYRPDSETHQFLDSAYDNKTEFQLIVNYIEDQDAGKVEAVIVSGNINSRMISGDKDDVVRMAYTYSPRTIISMGTRVIPPVLRRGDYGVGSDGTPDYPQYSPQEAEGNAFVMIPAADTDNPAGVDLYGIELVSQPTGQSNTNLMLTNSGDLRIYARNNTTPWSRVYTSGESDTLYLSKTNNLSDVDSVIDARTNLVVYSKLEGDARYMMGSRNLSEIVDIAAARTKLGVQSIAQSDSRYLQAINNLSDIDDVTIARTNLGIQSATESDYKYVPKTTTINSIALSGNITLSSTDTGSLAIINNLSDVADVVQARTNLGIQSTTESDSKYLIKSNNLSDLSDLTIARANLDVAKTDDVFLKADNLQGIIDRPAAWLNVRPLGATPLSGDPVSPYDATTKRWVENLIGAGVTGPTMNGVMNYGVGKPSFNSTRAYIAPYELPMDGQLVEREKWPELWAYAQIHGASEDADWMAIRTARGQYSKGNGTTTFRLPDWNGKRRNGDMIDGVPFSGVDSIHALFARGDGVEPGDNAGTGPGVIRPSATPNITGGFIIATKGSNGFGLSGQGFSGSFYNGGGTGSRLVNMDSNIVADSAGEVVHFEASRSNAAYGRDNSPEVRPNSVTAVWVVRASGGFTATNTSWSVSNGDTELPPVNTAVSGGKVQSKYKVGTNDNFGADFYAFQTIGNGITEARTEAHGTKTAVMRFNSEGNLGIPGIIRPTGGLESPGNVLARAFYGTAGGYTAAVQKLKDQQTKDDYKVNQLSYVANDRLAVTNYTYFEASTGIDQYVWQLGYAWGTNAWFSMRSDNGFYTPEGRVSIQGSDIRIKNNFEPVQPGAWGRISKIGICEYTYKSNPIPQRGYLAQQMEEIDPIYVFEGGKSVDDDGKEFEILNVNDKAVNADLITVVQELQARIEDQQEQITQLMGMVHSQSIAISELKNK